MEQGRAWFFDLMRRYGFEADRGSRRLAVCVLIVAWGVTWTGLMQQPTYEATAVLLLQIHQQQWWANSGGSGEEIQTLEYRGLLVQTMLPAIESRPVAAETIERLDLPMEPNELLDRLRLEQAENTDFIALSYTDTDPQRAKLIANTVGKVVAEFASDRSEFSAKVWRKAAMPTAPVRPHPFREGLLVLLAGLALSSAPIAPARAALAAAAGKLGERVRLVVVQGVAQAQALGRPRRALSETERHKEQELLRALGRRGKLSALEAALETSLSVEDASRMLYELAVRGQLEMSVEHGRLIYSFWGKDDA